MGHAEHFLSRLARLDADQVELALALYRDPPLVRAVIEAAKVPEGTGRVALALTSAPAPPHVLVARDGAFVTCLGAGMSVSGVHVVPHAQFLALRQSQISLRQIWDRARAAVDDGALGRHAFKHLLENGGAVTAEEMQWALIVAPLWGSDLLDALRSLSEDSDRIRDQLLGERRPDRSCRADPGLSMLRMLWQLSWSVPHFSVALTAIDPERRASQEIFAKMMSATFYASVECAFLPFAVRLCWVLARIGAPAGDLLEPAADSMTGSVFEAFCWVALAAIGAASPALRERALRFFAERESAARPDSIAHILREVVLTLREPEPSEAALLAAGRQMVWAQLRAKNQHRWSSPEHIPERLARAMCANQELDLIDKSANGLGFYLLLHSTPWLGRAKAEELYFPAGEVALATPFTLERGLAVLHGHRHFHGAPEPVRVEPTPGRNEPCPCASGKKFKKCCAAASAP